MPFDPAHPLTTPRDLNTGDPSVRSALADAVQFFAAHKVPLGIPLASTQHYAGVPLPGCTEGEGCFDRVEGDAAAGNGVDTDVNNGSSFIMATERLHGARPPGQLPRRAGNRKLGMPVRLPGPWG